MYSRQLSPGLTQYTCTQLDTFLAWHTVRCACDHSNLLNQADHKYAIN